MRSQNKPSFRDGGAIVDGLGLLDFTKDRMSLGEARLILTQAKSLTRS